VTLRIETLRGAAIAPLIDGLADLRIAVFRDWPYLYDGDRDYERRYLSAYRDNPRAIMVAAFDGAALVGAATALPLGDHDEEFGEALVGTPLTPANTLYCAESVLLPAFRGQGVYARFFAEREAAGREMGLDWAAFCGVIRPEDHPMRPADAQGLGPVWRHFGYAPVPGAVAQFHWKDLGEAEETPKPLQFWIKRL
jgi:GNAT superfamily N-acetyltransferase